MQKYKVVWCDDADLLQDLIDYNNTDGWQFDQAFSHKHQIVVTFYRFDYDYDYVGDTEKEIDRPSNEEIIRG